MTDPASTWASSLAAVAAPKLRPQIKLVKSGKRQVERVMFNKSIFQAKCLSNAAQDRVHGCNDVG
jgi:hypothetical protein